MWNSLLGDILDISFRTSLLQWSNSWKTRVAILTQDFRHLTLNLCIFFVCLFLRSPMKPTPFYVQICNKTSHIASYQKWTTLAWCWPAPSSNQLWCIMRDTWLSERAADLHCLDELRHFQAHTGHWLEWLNSQPAVYQRKETGNQFPNAVWGYSPPLWYTRHCADVDRNVRGHVWLYSWQTEKSPNKDQMASRKKRERLPNINLASEAMIEDCHLMALSKWVQLSWGGLWFLIT